MEHTRVAIVSAMGFDELEANTNAKLGELEQDERRIKIVEVRVEVASHGTQSAAAFGGMPTRAIATIVYEYTDPADMSGVVAAMQAELADI